MLQTDCRFTFKGSIRAHMHDDIGTLQRACNMSIEHLMNNHAYCTEQFCFIKRDKMRSARFLYFIKTVQKQLKSFLIQQHEYEIPNKEKMKRCTIFCCNSLLKKE